MSTEDLFDAPGSIGSIKFAEHENRLVLIWARAVQQQTYQGEAKDVTVADVVVLDEPGGPIEYKGTMIFPKIVQARLRGNVGRDKPCLGRIGKGQAKAGQSAPWELKDPTEADKQAAVAYLKEPNAKPASGGGGGGGGGWTGGQGGGNYSGNPPF